MNDAGELQVEVGQKGPGTALSCEVMRDGKNVNVPVTLEAMGSRDKAREETSADHGKPRWGVGLSDITADAREQLQAPAKCTERWSNKCSRAARRIMLDCNAAT